MANNRLYIMDTKTKEIFLLAKGFGTWSLRKSNMEIQEWLELRDFGSAEACDIPTSLRLVTEHELHEENYDFQSHYDQLDRKQNE